MNGKSLIVLGDNNDSIDRIGLNIHRNSKPQNEEKQFQRIRQTKKTKKKEKHSQRKIKIRTNNNCRRI